MKKDFITVNDFTKEELLEIIEISRAIKKSIKEGYYAILIMLTPITVRTEQIEGINTCPFRTDQIEQ